MTSASFLDQLRAANKRKRGYHRLGKPASQRRLDQWHKDHPHWTLPAEYADFLREANGIELKAGADSGSEFTFLSLERLQWVPREIWRDDTSRDSEYEPTWLCITTDPDGMRYFILDTATGHYLMIDHEAPSTIAEDMATLDDLLTWVSTTYVEDDEQLPPPKPLAPKVAQPKPLELVELPRFDDHESALSRMAVPRCGGLAATADFDGLVKIWDTERLCRLHQIDVRQFFSARSSHIGADNLAFSPDGRLLAISCFGWLWVIDWRADQVRWKSSVVCENNQFALHALNFSPDGRLLAGADGACLIHVWDVESGREATPFCGHESQSGRREPNVVNSLCFSPDGQLLASGDSYKSLRLWDVGTRQDLNRFSVQRWPVWRLAFSPDGGDIACGYGSNKAINIWAVSTGEVRHSLSGRGGIDTIAMAYSSDGRWLASGGRDSRLRLWDLRCGREVAQSRAWYDNAQGDFHGIAFIQGGRRLLGASAIGQIGLFEVPREA